MNDLVSGGFPHDIGLDGMLNALGLAVLLGDDGLLLHGPFLGVSAASGVNIGTAGVQTEISGDAGKLVQTDTTDTGVVAGHVGIRITTGLKSFVDIAALNIGILTESLGIKIDVFHVLRSEIIFHLNPVQRTVASWRLGVKGVYTHGTIGIIKTTPDRAN